MRLSHKMALSDAPLFNFFGVEPPNRKEAQMKYMYNCQFCRSYRNENIWGNQVEYCAANVYKTLKCCLRPRVLNPEIAEFFNATCERYRDAR